MWNVFILSLRRPDSRNYKVSLYPLRAGVSSESHVNRYKSMGRDCGLPSSAIELQKSLALVKLIACPLSVCCKFQDQLVSCSLNSMFAKPWLAEMLHCGHA